MYILIPLLLIAISFSGIIIIIARKFPHLNKLNPQSYEVNDNILADFFPEALGVVKKVKLKELWHQLLLEAEKLLRRFRVLFLRVDRISDVMIKKIRKVHRKSIKNGNAGLVAESGINQNKPETQEALLMSNISSVSDKSIVQDEVAIAGDLKNQEKDLIIKIAQNPKDAKLYEKLGDLYYKMGDLNDAKESYETSLKIDRENENIKKKLDKVLKKLPA